MEGGSGMNSSIKTVMVKSKEADIDYSGNIHLDLK
jgi:hypothetical protein